MRFLKFYKRQNELERCLILWTPWVTSVWDFGSVLCKGTDEFELVIKHKAWGPIFYWGNRDVEKLGERNKFDRFQFTKIQPRYAELRKRRIDERDFYEHKEQLVRDGKRKNPANMSYAERHAATLVAIKRMKFSDNFVHLMTTPVAKLALERGEVVEDYDFNGQKTGRILTDEWFEADKKDYVRDYSLPGMARGIIGFKKAESGEGYEVIRVPVARQGEIANGQVDRLKLEAGQ
jgi:hypothetical protein